MNPWIVMGLDHAPSADGVRRRYRQLAKKLHPDVNKAADASVRFRELTEAYDLIRTGKVPPPTHPVKRREPPRTAAKPPQHAGREKYHRVLHGSGDHFTVKVLDENFLKMDCVIICMVHDRELHIELDAGTPLPHHIRITNWPSPLTMTITSGGHAL